MAVRSILLSVLMLLCASPILADSLNDSAPITVAKINDAEQKSIPHLDIPHELLVKESYHYYDIDGTTLADLKHQMNRKGTKWNDGNVYAALTTWDIRYHYDVADQDGKYSVKNVTTDIDIVYHFPRRRPPTGADAVAEPWKLYVDNLKTHEFGHKDLAVKAAAEINDTLAGMGSFDSSGDLDTRARALVQAKLKHLKEVQIAYDEETHHGETQGAFLH